ncbi:hypothetical protein PM082_018310 [Marasmius tenuissimus]|nr:hypothetical protein PM082_018310 [Marasmius tenuissimus]
MLRWLSYACPTGSSVASRSGYGLRFSFEASFKVSDPFTQADIEALRILATYSNHWQSVTLSVPVSEGEGTVEGCLEPLQVIHGNLASLENLNISTLFHEQYEKNDYVPRYLAEAFEIAPRLKAFTSGRFWQVDTLRFGQVSLPWSQIQHLDFVDRVEMDTYQVLQLVRSSLRSASITTISRTSTLRPTPTALITLPFLKTLIHINNHPRSPWGAGGQIFEYLRLPNLESLTLTDERERHSYQEAFMMLERSRPPHIRTLTLNGVCWNPGFDTINILRALGEGLEYLSIGGVLDARGAWGDADVVTEDVLNAVASGIRGISPGELEVREVSFHKLKQLVLQLDIWPKVLDSDMFLAHTCDLLEAIARWNTDRSIEERLAVEVFVTNNSKLNHERLEELKMLISTSTGGDGVGTLYLRDCLRPGRSLGIVL